MNRLLWNKLQNSLLLRVGGMIAAITILAVVGMSTSWMVAETTQGNGEAINVAGSLRMQSWRMASFYQRLLQTDKPEYRETLQQAIGRFEHDLKAGPILTVLPKDETTPLKQVYRRVETDWQNRIKPALALQSSTAQNAVVL
ncbi:MAG: type IV pili methyl-accepting chemotaxis transducer N-terminal domain-containing protein, partial [Thiothrix litoralis]